MILAGAARPDVREGPNAAERWLQQEDALAQVPGLAVGFKLPGGRDRDHVAAAVLGEVLAGGAASRLYLGLVKGQELLLQVEGGANWPLGSPWQVEGPTLMTFFALYKPTTDARRVVTALEEVVGRIAREGVPDDELARVRTKLESDLYSSWEQPMGRADALAVAQLFTGDAASLNSLPARIRAVSSDDLRRVASTFLTAANRTVVDRRPAAAAATPAR